MARFLDASAAPRAKIKVAAIVERHLKGILAYCQAGLTTGFLQGLNSPFSAVKLKAQGYRSRECMIAMLYFVAGKLSIPSTLSH